MDGIVTSVVRSGFFVSCGSLEAFVSRAVNLPSTSLRLSIC